MIKIIKGSYGMRVGKIVKAISAGTTIEIGEEKEARLVRIGVAEYVTDDEQVADLNEAPDLDADVEVSDELPEYSESMKLSDLRKVAEAYGVDASAMRTKKEVIEAIEEAKELPDLDVSDIVE